jgi:hypothetical protein
MSGERSADGTGDIILGEEDADLLDCEFWLAVCSIGPFRGGLTSKVEEILNVSSLGEGA